MNNLIKESNQLKEKQSWVRNSFQEFLNRWKKATDNDINDRKLRFLPVGGFHESPYGTNQLYLCRGSAYLWVISSGMLAHQTRESDYDMFVENNETVDIKSDDMQYIRTALNNIPGAIEEHIGLMQELDEEYDQLGALISS